MKTTLLVGTLALFGVGLVGCGQNSSAILTAEGRRMSGWEWETWDRGKAAAVRTLWVTEQTSHHLVRLASAEKPHVHDRHDVTVFLLSGKVRMHLGDQAFEMKAGDVVQIPHGLAHWAENLAGSASEAYAVFSPPFDGKDKRLIEP